MGYITNGEYFGGAGMYITTIDALRFGQLYLTWEILTVGKLLILHG